MLFSHGNSSYSHCKELEPTVLASEGHRMHPLVFCGHPTPANTDISTIFLSFAIMLDTHLKKNRSLLVRRTRSWVVVANVQRC